MKCDTARDHMLEVDLEELSGRSASPLGSHLATCAACRALADRIVAGERALAAALDTERPRRPADRALEAARGVAMTRPRRWRFRVAIPALAAASVAAILLVRGTVDLGAPNGQPVAAASAAAPLVEPPAGRTAAVFGTRDPDIVVVWIF